jgi:hypothetical protein
LFYFCSFPVEALVQFGFPLKQLYLHLIVLSIGQKILGKQHSMEEQPHCCPTHGQLLNGIIRIRRQHVLHRLKYGMQLTGIIQSLISMMPLFNNLAEKLVLRYREMP